MAAKKQKKERKKNETIKNDENIDYLEEIREEKSYN